jgi:hypothetical protein
VTTKKERFKKTLLDLAKSGRFIEGIYNYCDRWCERCTMTTKCLSYAHEQEMKSGEENQEINDAGNEKFWEQISLSFEAVKEMIQEDAERLGIDLNNLEDVELPEHIKTPLEKLSENYAHTIHKWMKANSEKLEDKIRQIFLIKSEAEARRVTDAWEVVQYYYFFIPPKVHRAHFELEERQTDDDEYNLYSDNLGSAKIAIIAIDRSIESLSIIYSCMEEYEDELLKFLSQLSRMKRQLLETFPEVVSFKRPGFDN